jgi:hypothetical protein
MTTPDAMSLIAKNATTQLLWDAGETERFYTYVPTTQTLTLLSDKDAKTFYQLSSSWTLPGSCFFGSTCGNWGYKNLDNH